MADGPLRRAIPDYPFAGSRSFSDLNQFLSSEWPRAAMVYAIDHYSDDMIGGGEPNPRASWFDAEGWYGFARHGEIADVQGGFGWRFEECAPHTLSRISRPALVDTRRGLKIGDDLWLSDPEMNTISRPWRNNPTLALMSTRRAR